MLQYPTGAANSSYAIPKGTTEVGRYSFEGAWKLKNIVLPNGLQTIGAGSLDGTGIASIKLPDSVSNIEPYAFCCEHLKTIDTGTNKNFTFENGALYDKNKTVLIQYVAGCKNTSFTLPASVTRICSNSFEAADNLKFVNLASSDIINRWGQGIFYNCTSLKSVKLPDTMTYLGVQDFYGCTSLASFTVPSEMLTIGYGVFSGCTSLASVNFKNADKLSDIYECAFYRTGISSITIPASVKSIGSDAFGSCKNLTGINVEDGNAIFKSVNGVLFDKDGELCVFPAKSPMTSYTIPAGVTRIVIDAFSGCSGLKDVTISDQVTKIDTESFEGYPEDVFGGCKDITIYCHEGSVAEAYAKSKNIKTSDSSAKSITAFSINNVTGKIDETNNTVALTLPLGTDVTALSPTVEVSDGAAVSPASLTEADFTNPVEYTVTAKDGTKQNYNVTVKLQSTT